MSEKLGFWVCDRCGAQYGMNITKCLFNACPTNREAPKPCKPLDRGRVLGWLGDNSFWVGDVGDLCLLRDELLEAINSGRLDAEEG